MRNGRLVTPRPLARLFVSGGQWYAPGARNRSQINVAGAVSSRLAWIQRCLRIRTIYQVVFQSFCSGVSATVRGHCQPATLFFSIFVEKRRHLALLDSFSDCGSG